MELYTSSSGITGVWTPGSNMDTYILSYMNCGATNIFCNSHYAPIKYLDNAFTI